MVNFGKSIVKAQRQGWEEAYLDYEELKEIVSEIEQKLTERKSVHFADAFSLQPKKRTLDELLEVGSPSSQVETLKQAFLDKLRSEIEKLSLFILQQQGNLADSVGALRFGGSFLFRHESEALIKSTDVENAALDSSNLLDQYSVLGVELLHLLKFVCVNAIGVQKILKKYNKCFERFDEPHHYDVNGDHLQQLAYSPSIRAIESSLQLALVESYSTLTENATAMAQLQVIRFQCVMGCNDRLRRNAEILQQPFLDFLARKAMILTGSNLGGMEGSGKKALRWLIQLKPEKLLAMTEAQLEELWSRWSGGPSVTWIREQDKLAHRRTQSLMTLKSTQSEDDMEDIVQEDETTWGGVNSVSMTLNLLSTLLYTINYYIVAPTANHYAIKLGADGAFGSTLIGASSFSAIFAAFFYSFWYTKSSFKSALIFSSLCPVFGNLVYALAISFSSMPMAIFGRILCGFGSAEVVNRQLISACVNFEGMTKASALFVASSAIGMSVGPLLAGILEITTGRDEEVDITWNIIPAGGLIWDHVTSPGFVMAGLWLLEFFALLFFFSEPKRINGSNGDGETSVSLDDSGDELSDEDSPLITKKNGYGTVPAIKHEEKKVVPRTLWSEIAATVKLIVQNPGLPLTVVIFGYIEMTDELLISSCAMITRRYFGWHGSVAGFLIASLGALVLPAHFVVEKASHFYSERRILSKSLIFLVVSLLGIMNWSGMYFDVAGFLASKDYDKAGKHETIAGEELGHVLTPEGEFLFDFGSGPVVYVIFLSAVFMGTIVLEGVDTSIMAKVTPSELNDRFFNCGLLATLVGTFGRVLADGMITLSALLDIHVLMDFVNATFAPILLLTLVGLYLVSKHYSDLV